MLPSISCVSKISPIVIGNVLSGLPLSLVEGICKHLNAIASETTTKMQKLLDKSRYLEAFTGPLGPDVTREGVISAVRGGFSIEPPRNRKPEQKHFSKVPLEHEEAHEKQSSYLRHSPYWTTAAPDHLQHERSWKDDHSKMMQATENMTRVECKPHLYGEGVALIWMPGRDVGVLNPGDILH